MSNNSVPIVSITIPTYNRGYLLKETLVALFSQIDEDQLYDQVEVVVCDNASLDNTAEVVNFYISQNKYRIIYNKNEENLGVIKNILKTVELSNGTFWMFYGDDDVVPKGALKKIINGFNQYTDFPAFMYRWQDGRDVYCQNLKNNIDFTVEELAKEFFYYIGNAGIFAIKTSKAKEVVSQFSNELLTTCWPQTLILFLAAELSERKKIKYLDIISSIPPEEGIVISNSYYLFETTIYSLLRTAICIENITKKNFVDIAVNSIYGIQKFDSLKQHILWCYCFFDSAKQKNDFEKAVKEANEKLPTKYKKETEFFYKQINFPLLFIKLKIYDAYIKSISFSNLKTSYIKKLKIISPFGFKAIINQKKASLESKKASLKRTEVDTSSGYF